jgi:hypothetical protein
MHHTIQLRLVMLALHIPVYLFWGWALFGSWGGFWDAIVFWFKPDF